MDKEEQKKVLEKERKLIDTFLILFGILFALSLFLENFLSSVFFMFSYLSAVFFLLLLPFKYENNKGIIFDAKAAQAIEKQEEKID